MRDEGFEKLKGRPLELAAMSYVMSFLFQSYPTGRIVPQTLALEQSAVYARSKIIEGLP